MEESYADWFSVRCVFRCQPLGDSPDPVYEERITLWRATSFDEAIELAEREAAEYAASIDAEYTELAQACLVDGEPVHGAEVFSLMRSSDLPTGEYLDHFFDDGREFQQTTD